MKFSSTFLNLDMDQQNPMGKKENSMQPAPTGNASNPSEKDPMQPAANQLIDERGEKYLRESAAPEDYPDVQDEEEAENQK